jgi:Tfp pilus assembly protein PilF
MRINIKWFGFDRLTAHCSPLTAVFHCSLLIALLACAAPSFAIETPTPIPPDSLNLLQDTYARTTELLWEQIDGYWHEGEFERCIALFRIITELDPSDIEAYSVGSWLMDSKDRPDEAQAYLEYGLSQNKDRYDLYEELGRFHFNKKDYKKASEYLQKAVSFPDCPVLTLHLLAHAYEKSGNLQKSLETWQHSAELEPDSVVVKNNLERVREQIEGTRTED